MKVDLSFVRCKCCGHVNTPGDCWSSGTGHEGEGGYGPVVVLLGDLLLNASQIVAAEAQPGMEASSFSLRKQFGNDLKKEHIFGRKMPQCESKAFFYFLYFTA